jgi:hypothetical protein
MDIHVRHDDSLLAGNPTLGFEPRENFRGQEMRAHRNIRFVVFQQFDQRPSVESIERKPASLVSPGFV